MNLEPLIELLRARIPELLAVYHFGATARGEANGESDVDLAFLSNELMPPQIVFGLQSDCAALAGRDVDLIELRRADPILICEVLDAGRAIYEADADAVAEFETASVSMAQAFNEETRVAHRELRL